MEGSLYVVPGRFRSNLSWLRALSIVHLIAGLALVIVLWGMLEDFLIASMFLNAENISELPSERFFF